ncbi:hypothetical protein RHS01_10198 [Rhizoctonia solani]|uniref:Uncharacterized protein n=2 Tax=Rhizoctonia solani TaxID=456999 RepID=A0A8H7LXG5_9AGAM|nr:hypothetical protein RHS01_10198 [Rhizoctonia solani]
MVVFRRLVYAITFAITMGVMVCAVPVANEVASSQTGNLGTETSASGHFAAKQSLVERQQGCSPAQLLRIIGAALMIDTTIIEQFIPNALDMAFVFPCAPRLTQSNPITGLHNPMTNTTSVLSSGATSFDQASRDATSLDIQMFITGMASACTFAAKNSGANSSQSTFAIIDNNTSAFMGDLSDRAQIDPAEMAPKDANIMKNFGACFPKTAKLLAPGA